MKNQFELKEIFKNHLNEKEIILEKESFDDAFKTFLRIREIYSSILSEKSNLFEPRQRMFGDQ
ncbi:MAG: hypothetical protein P8K05_05780 [Dehalococcoidia bacterium]|jgi:hypothetical protein|nr:hypothetical protein [Dehalococcoidia bacterium]